MPLSRFAVMAASLSLSTLTFAASSTSYPLTVDNCGVPLTFNKAPGKAVTIGDRKSTRLNSSHWE